MSLKATFKLFLLFISLSFITKINAQLSIGDVAFTRVNMDNPDDFSIVLLTDVASGEIISFTDKGWNATGGFSSGESVLTWTLDDNMTCGTQVSISGTTITNDGGFTNGSISGSALNLSNAGDQIFAFYGAVLPSAGTESLFLAAVQNNGSGWDSDAGSTRESAKPSVFTDGVTSLVVSSHIDNIQYNCSRYASADVNLLRTAINDFTNYNTHNSTRFSAFSCNILCSDLPPVIVCPSDTIISVNSGVCEGNFVFSDPICTEFCAGLTIVRTDGSGLNSGDDFPTGVTTISYDVSNLAGTTTCTYNVSVTDDEDPQISCPGDISLPLPSTGCSRVVTYTVPVASDNCPGEITTQTDGEGYTSGDAFPLGVTYQEFTAQDANFNETVCGFDVELYDDTDPTLTCFDTIKFDVLAGVCDATITYALPALSDNCSFGLSVTQTDLTGISSGDILSVGNYTLEFTGFDDTGNSDVCNTVLSVRDLIDPTISCPSDITVNTDASSCDANVSISAPIANDNCGIASVINDFNGTADASDVYPVGTTIVEFIILDNANNQASCSFNVTVNDIENPTITCAPDMNVNALPGACDANVSVSPPVSLDNCTVLSTLNDYNGSADASGLYNAGTTVVSWTVTDGTGNTNTCIQNILVRDNTPPVIACTDTLFFNTSTVDCLADVIFTDPVPTDNCPGLVTLNRTDLTGIVSGDKLTPDSITISWEAIDISTNIATCSTVLAISDDTDPVITCPSDQVLSNDPNVCTAIATVPLPTVSDNCGVASFLNDFNGTSDASGNYNSGVTTVEYTITDTYGNIATCDFTITVNDTENPTITCANDTTIFITAATCDVTATINQPTVSDNCTGALTVVNDRTFTNDVSGTYTMGTYAINWTVTDGAGLNASCMQTIDVVDNSTPVYTCTDTVKHNITTTGCSANITVPQPNVTAACSGYTLTNNITGTNNADGVYNVGFTDVEWTFVNGSGNTSNCTTVVAVYDLVDPTITCPADQTVNNDVGLCTANVLVPLPTVNDNCSVLSTLNDFNGLNDASGIYNEGTTSVTYTVTDISGNTNTCSFDVTVNDNETPTITCASNVTLFVTSASMCSVNATINGPSITDNCSSLTLINDYNGTNDASGNYPLGVHNVNWTVTDAATNASTCTQVVTVLDNSVPIFTCTDTVKQDVLVATNCFENVTVTQPVITSSCSPITVTNNITGTSNADGVYNVGNTDVIWTLTNTAGATVQCTTVVDVNDVIDPTITCPSDVAQGNDSGGCPATVTIPLPTMVNDNCGVLSYSNDFNATTDASDLYPNGVTTVTYTIDDVNGNSNTCSFTVTISDTEAPVITCPNDTTLYISPVTCDANATINLPTATDNCFPSVTFVNDYNGTGDASDTYTLAGSPYTVNWTVTDPDGNPDMCAQTITVLDTLTPVYSCTDTVKQDVLIATNCDENVVVSQPSISGFCAGYTLSNDYNLTNDASDVYPVGFTDVEWTFTSGAITRQCTTVVAVYDVIVPTIVCPSDITQGNDPGGCPATIVSPLPTVNDNCGVLSYSNDFNATTDASGLYPNGVTVVTYTVNDVNGNTNTCSFNVTVTDTEAPVITCPNDTTLFITGTTCDVNATINLPSATDNCFPNVNFINDYNNTGDASDVYPLGITNVHWTVTDPDGNPDVCTQVITVVDNTNPTINCTDTLRFSTSTVDCLADVIFTAPTTSDNCPGGVSLLRTDITGIVSGDRLPVDSVTISYQATDLAGNTETCDVVLAVFDDVKPTITCPADVVVSNDPSTCDANVTIALPTVADNCSIDSYTNDFTGLADASTVYPIGTTTVTYQVFDIYNNDETCSFNVTVNDAEAPVITCPNDTSLFITTAVCNYSATLPMATATDNCVGTLTYTNDFNGTSDASDTYPLGVTTVEWTVSDINSNTSTCTFNVDVIDQYAPDLTCTDTMRFYTSTVDCLSDLIFTDPVPTDNCSSTITLNRTDLTGIISGDRLPIDTVQISYEAIDEAGNTSSCSSVIVTIDNVVPTIICPANITANNDAGVCEANIVVPSPNVNDNCSVLVYTNDYNSLSDASGVYPVGVTAIVYNVSDVYGNTANCTFVVTVNDVEAPSVVCPGDTTLKITNNTLCGEEYSLPLISSTDNCTSVTESINLPLGFTNGDTLLVGGNAFEVSYTDLNGNTITCNFNVDVVDTIVPNVLCFDTIIPASLSTCDTVIDNTMYQISDACGIASITRNDSEPVVFGSSWGVGVYDLEFEVEDMNGNLFVCNSKVEVLDLESPSIICPDDSTIFVSAGGCEELIVLNNPVTNDFCSGIDTLFRTDNSGVVSGQTVSVGIYNIAYQTIDSSGNTASCQYQISILDSLGLQVVCPNDTAICDTIVNYKLPDVSVNCVPLDSIYITNGPNIGDTVPTGIYTIEIDVRDTLGYTKTCSFSLDVNAPLFVDAGLDTTLCNSQSLSLNAVDSSIYTQTEWYSDQIVTYNDSSLNNAITQVLTPGTYVFYWNVSDGVCTALDSVSVFVGDSLNKPYVGEDVLICADSVQLDVVTTSLNGVWKFDSTMISLSDSNSVNAIAYSNGDGETTIIWEVDNGVCGYQADTINITFGTTPIALEDTSVTILEGESEIIKVYDVTASSINWSPTTYLDDTLSFVTESTPDQTIEYTITFFDDYGCNDSMKYEIIVENDSELNVLEINNVITPNGDGKNDTWIIDNVEDYEQCNFKIYNRWGQEVFSSKGYDNSWNGTYKGRELPEGAYYYLIDCDGEEVIKAAISIVRYKK